jgi:TolB protein
VGLAFFGASREPGDGCGHQQEYMANDEPAVARVDGKGGRQRLMGRRRSPLVSFTLLLAVGAGAISAPARGHRSAASGRDGLIAFAAGDCRSGSCQIWVMDGDGSHMRRLTRGRDPSSQPSFSPGGARISFARTENGRDQVWIMDADGSDQRAITHALSGANQPQFSPDGSRIIISERGLTATCLIACGPTHIAIVNADGSHQRLLTNSRGSYDSEPSFSPNGRTIVFTRRTGDGLALAMWVMNADGSDPRALTHNASAREGQARFSPNGRTIVYRSDRTGRSQIWLMNRDGSQQRLLTHDRGSDNEPFFSPDGRRIVFESDRSGAAQIWVMDADGSDQHQLTHGAGNHSEPQWAPR